jgi:hypothetical protein
MAKSLQQPLDAAKDSKGSDVESDSSDDGDFVPSGSGRLRALLRCALLISSSGCFEIPLTAFTVAVTVKRLIRTSAMAK